MGRQSITGAFNSGPAAVQVMAATAVTQMFGTPAYGGSVAWTGSGAPPASVTLSLVTSEMLLLSTPSLGLPAGAVITSIFAQLTATTSGVAPKFSFVGLYNPATGVMGGNQAPFGTPLTGTHDVTSGLPTWGVPCSPADFNTAQGVTVGLEVYSDAGGGGGTATLTSATITVYYTTTGVPVANVADVGTNAFAGWTPGAYQLLTIPEQPGLTSPWVVEGFGVTYSGLHVLGNEGTPPYGTFGKLWAGLVSPAQRSTLTSGGVTLPWVQPCVALPPQASLLGMVWDGAQDQMFPTFSTAKAAQTLDTRSTTINLSSPLLLQPGEQVTVGLWLTPSLVSNINTVIYNAQYEILYDDAPTLPVTTS
jgi:hypothetical protein